MAKLNGEIKMNSVKLKYVIVNNGYGAAFMHGPSFEQCGSDKRDDLHSAQLYDTEQDAQDEIDLIDDPCRYLAVEEVGEFEDGKRITLDPESKFGNHTEVRWRYNALGEVLVYKTKEQIGPYGEHGEAITHNIEEYIGRYMELTDACCELEAFMGKVDGLASLLAKAEDTCEGFIVVSDCGEHALKVTHASS